MAIKTQQQSRRIQGILMVVLATFFWSTSGIFISLTIQNSNINTVSLAFWRDLSTFLILLLGIVFTKPSLLRVNPKDLPWLIMAAVSIGLFHILWNTSIFLIGASISTVIQSNSTIFVTLMAWIFFKEPLTVRKIVAVLLSVAGTLLISGRSALDSDQIPILGLVVALFGAILYGLFSLLGKKLTGSYNPWTILLYVFGFASLTLLPFQIIYPSPFPYQAPAIFYFAGLVFGPSILGFALYTTALGRLQASNASIISQTEIVFASILAFAFLGERLHIWQIMGAVLVVSGVILVSLSNGTNRLKIQK
jgi:drug/metabolite transporter (DMT)-like permease